MKSRFLPLEPSQLFTFFVNVPFVIGVNEQRCEGSLVSRPFHRSQLSGTFAFVKSRADAFVDNKGIHALTNP